jgi:hypothetical protein
MSVGPNYKVKSKSLTMTNIIHNLIAVMLVKSKATQQGHNISLYLLIIETEIEVKVKITTFRASSEASLYSESESVSSEESR